MILISYDFSRLITSFVLLLSLCGGVCVVTAKNMTLVIAFGIPRGGQMAINSLFRNVLDFYLADLALLGPYNLSQGVFRPMHEQTLINRAEFIWDKLDAKNWSLELTSVAGNSTNWLNLCNNERDAVISFCGSKACRWRWKCTHALQIMYREYTRQKMDILHMYDWIVYTRADFYYLCPLPSLQQLDYKRVYIPTGMDFSGINDRLVIFHSNASTKVLSLALSLVRDWKRYIEELLPQNELTNAEKLWKIYLEVVVEMRIERFDNVAFTVNSATHNYHGFQSTGVEVLDFSGYNSNIRYRDEYESAKHTCPRKYWTSHQKYDKQFHNKLFAYLIQSEEYIDIKTRLPTTEQRDIYQLAFRSNTNAPENSSFYSFNSSTSWGSGRNQLLSMALTRSNGSYAYYIFMDDDILDQLESGSGSKGYDAFESWLLEVRPRIGYLTNAASFQIKDTGKITTGLSNVDANLNAFHSSTLGLVLPYDNYMEKQSAFYSQYIQNFIVSTFYRHKYSRVGNNDIEIDIQKNRHNAKYRRAVRWKRVHNYIESVVTEASSFVVPDFDTMKALKYEICEGPRRRDDTIDEGWLRSNLNITHPFTLERFNFLSQFSSILRQQRRKPFHVECQQVEAQV